MGDSVRPGSCALARACGLALWGIALVAPATALGEGYYQPYSPYYRPYPPPAYTYRPARSTETAVARSRLYIGGDGTLFVGNDAYRLEAHPTVVRRWLDHWSSAARYYALGPSQRVLIASFLRHYRRSVPPPAITRRPFMRRPITRRPLPPPPAVRETVREAPKVVAHDGPPSGISRNRFFIGADGALFVDNQRNPATEADVAYWLDHWRTRKKNLTRPADRRLIRSLQSYYTSCNFDCAASGDNCRMTGAFDSSWKTENPTQCQLACIGKVGSGLRKFGTSACSASSYRRPVSLSICNPGLNCAATTDAEAKKSGGACLGMCTAGSCFEKNRCDEKLPAVDLHTLVQRMTGKCNRSGFDGALGGIAIPCVVRIPNGQTLPLWEKAAQKALVATIQSATGGKSYRASRSMSAIPGLCSSGSTGGNYLFLVGRGDSCNTPGRVTNGHYVRLTCGSGNAKSRRIVPLVWDPNSWDLTEGKQTRTPARMTTRTVRGFASTRFCYDLPGYSERCWDCGNEVAAILDADTRSPPVRRLGTIPDWARVH